MQRVVTRFIGDASTRVAALEAGEIDISDATPILDMKRFGETKGYATMIGNAAGIPFGLELNGSKGIFADVRVRRALAMAVDRKALSDNLFFGLIDPAYGPLSKGTPGYWAGCGGDVQAGCEGRDGAAGGSRMEAGAGRRADEGRPAAQRLLWRAAAAGTGYGGGDPGCCASGSASI